MHPRYVFYLTLFEGFLQPLNELQTGTSYPAVRDRDVFAQRIRLAPFPEQRAIVAKIEQLFSELDNGIANLRAAKDKLAIYSQSVLNQAFSGELTLSWREENPYPDAYLDKIHKRLEDFNEQKLGQDVPRQLPVVDLGDLPPLPFGWIWARSP